jgi:hypothetical protein
MSENFLDVEQLDLFQYTSTDSSQNLVTWQDIYNKKRLGEKEKVVKIYPPSDDPYKDIGYESRKKRRG